MNHKIHAGKGMEKKIQRTYLNKKKDSQSSGSQWGEARRRGETGEGRRKKKKRNKLKGTVGWRGGCGQRAGGLDFIIMEAQT